MASSSSSGASRHSQGSHCHSCRKLIVWPGLCYTCATGRPRTILRPEERLGLEAGATVSTDFEPPSAN